MTDRMLRYRLSLTASVAILLVTGCIITTPEEGDTTPNGTSPQDVIAAALANTAPSADAGEDQSVAAGAEVTLNGTGSSDTDGDRLSYVWRQVGGTPSLTIQNPFASIARFTAPDDLTRQTKFTFTLTVVDGFAADHDNIVITVAAGS